MIVLYIHCMLDCHPRPEARWHGASLNRRTWRCLVVAAARSRHFGLVSRLQNCIVKIESLGLFANNCFMLG